MAFIKESKNKAKIRSMIRQELRRLLSEQDNSFLDSLGKNPEVDLAGEEGLEIPPADLPGYSGGQPANTEPTEFSKETRDAYLKKGYKEVKGLSGAKWLSPKAIGKPITFFGRRSSNVVEFTLVHRMPMRVFSTSFVLITAEGIRGTKDLPERGANINNPGVWTVEDFEFNDIVGKQVYVPDRVTVLHCLAKSPAPGI